MKNIASIVHKKVLSNSSSSKKLLLTLSIATIGLSALLTVIGPASKVYAGGGVGSGGTGGCTSSCGTGNYTWYGWGWAVYQTSGPGPHDGFHNGTSWNSVQSICNGANALHVDMFIIDDQNGNGMVYDYTNEDGPPQYADHFAAGTTVDNGNAVAIDSSTAYNDFQQLGANGVSTAGFTWDTSSGNVGWFCSDFQPKDVTIQGRIVNQANNQPQPGVSVYNCATGGYASTNSNGFYSFTLKQGVAFCLRPQSFTYNGTPVSSSQLYDRPWGFNYGDPAARCPNYSSVTPYQGNCTPINDPPVVSESNQTYECQVAGVTANEPCPGNSSNNTWVGSGGGTGYDFVFNSSITAGATISVTASCSSGTVTAVITAVDTNNPNAVSWDIDGGSPSGSTNLVGGAPNWSGTVTTSGASGSHTFYVSSPTAGFAQSTFTCPPPNPCPTFPNANRVVVSEPDQAPNQSGQSGATNTPNQQYTQETQCGSSCSASPCGYGTCWQYNTDISPGGNRYPPNFVSQQYQQVTIDYTPYVNNYPYDLNQPSVTYNSYYDSTNWYTSSTPDYYTCPDGGTNNNNGTCTLSTSACSSPYSWNGSTCEDSGTGSCTATDSSGNCIACSQGSPPSCSYDYTTSPSCPSGYTQSGSTCYENYTATYWYDWHQGTTTDAAGYVANTVDGPIMPACYDRSFTLHPNDATGSPGTSVSFDNNNNENPTSFSVHGSVTGIFGISGVNRGDGFRQPTQVDGITTQVTVSIYHEDANGTWSVKTINQPNNPYSGETSPNLQPSPSPSGCSSSWCYQSGCYTYSNCTANYTVNWDNVPASMPPLEYGDEVCINLTTNPSVGDTSPSTTNNPLATPYSWNYSNITTGVYNQGSDTYAWSNGGDPTPKTGSGIGNINWPPGVCTAPLAAEPYTKVFGGDTSAGVGMQHVVGGIEECSLYSSANIASWNQGSSGGYAGAGTQLADFAAQQITGFASAQNATAGPPLGLAFANDTGGFGGYFGTSPSNCADDYYNHGVNGDGGANGQHVQACPGSFSSLASGSYSCGATSTSGFVVNKGSQIVLYVNGDFHISGDICYLGNCNSSRPISDQNPSQLPSLTVVSTGTINIDPSVNEIDGTYIAENGINDCYGIATSSMYTDPTDTNPADNCKTQLLVNGSLLTNGSLLLYRTCDSLHQASTDETFPDSGAATSNPGTCLSQNTSTSAAEAVGYSGLVWLSSSSIPTAPAVQSITSLPPVL